jgi:NitT/TauT family transport system ATP-binding protein
MSEPRAARSAVAAVPGARPLAGDILVQARGISKVYDGGVEALHEVAIDCPRGQLTTLLGPSGCGKTTLLKIIAGLIEPTGGEILIAGRAVRGPGPERAFVFQDFALMPWATVLRNVAFGLELRGVPKREREEVACRCIAEVRLSGFEHTYPHQLSGGMRQRVGLARALAVDADILLMDEPFASVDEQTRRKFQEDLLALLAIERKTVIFVTHSIEEAVYVSDQIVLLSERPGRVSKIVRPGLERSGDFERIRRERAYLDCVDEIWNVLKRYLQD